jgi:hypothetical protein
MFDPICLIAAEEVASGANPVGKAQMAKANVVVLVNVVL